MAIGVFVHLLLLLAASVVNHGSCYPVAPTIKIVYEIERSWPVKGSRNLIFGKAEPQYYQTEMPVSAAVTWDVKPLPLPSERVVSSTGVNYKEFDGFIL